MPTVFNAANELAVRKFLHRKKSAFWIFTRLSAQSMERHTADRESGAGGDLAVEKRLINGLKAGGRLKIIIAIIIFSAIILFHELGHFLLAKKNGSW